MASHQYLEHSSPDYTEHSTQVYAEHNQAELQQFRTLASRPSLHLDINGGKSDRISSKIDSASLVRSHSSDDSVTSSDNPHDTRDPSPRAKEMSKEDRDSELDSVLISPILQLALVETPKERVLVRSRSSSVRKNSLGVLESLPYVEKSLVDVEHEQLPSNICFTPGGTKKSVKFGTASLFDNQDCQGSYFPMRV